ncbi:uncharacterized protein BDW47DRAFT_88300 [Aspergillus candidus]|uniref:Pyridoxamine 5'-phosphate oxidase N-terminal domain-containing protein n=1 Tax=Aspergillus candidus TaxID=41067 RepID=A0A2I2FIN6_ASPCN|nr:hypothetical protein BDW47DRAFT_88300 [Aspergillus candidus]PLB40483.1 hypothetical protein BDW47DRAFT_88300 [Aspergillus candidus]
MPTFYPSLTPSLTTWATQQPVFFVCSAPLRGKHINMSPKGMADTSLAIMGPNEAAYIDMTGSGNETIAHVRENGRLTVMFCSFETTPRILRLFCTGRVVEAGDEGAFGRAVERMGLSGKVLVGARAVIVLDIFKVQTSCGFGVPRLALTVDPDTDKPTPTLATRDTWLKEAERLNRVGKLEGYRAEWNTQSLDGLPGLESARKESGGLRSVWWGRVGNWSRWYRTHIEWVVVVAMVAFHFYAYDVYPVILALSFPLLLS